MEAIFPFDRVNIRREVSNNASGNFVFFLVAAVFFYVAFSLDLSGKVIVSYSLSFQQTK